VDNPLQAKRSSGVTDITPVHLTPKWVELLRSFGGQRAASTPSCASLARGYPRVRPTVLLYLHDFNLLK